MSSKVSCQVLSDSFTIGKYGYAFSKDSLILYFNCAGAIVEKRCASFYRIGRVDTVNIGFVGAVADYYPDSTKAFEGTLVGGYLSGEAIYYYENGNVKSKGDYERDLRDGTWKFYYENGQLKQILNFVNGNPLIVEYYTKKGKQKVKNSEGKYNGEYYPPKACSPIRIRGHVENGLRVGKWISFDPYHGHIIGTEYYNRGIFQRGASGTFVYQEKHATLIQGFEVHEAIQLADAHPGCPGDTLYMLWYRNEYLGSSFYPEFERRSKEFLNSQKNQWFLVNVKIDKQSEISAINVRSSIDDQASESILYNILKSMNNFKAATRGDKPIESDLVFTVLIRNGELIVPVTYLRQMSVN